jgi:hypothetical protein
VHNEDFARASVLKAKRDAILTGGGRGGKEGGGMAGQVCLSALRGSVSGVLVGSPQGAGGGRGAGGGGWQGAMSIEPRSPSMLISAEDLEDGEEGGG